MDAPAFHLGKWCFATLNMPNIDAVASAIADKFNFQLEHTVYRHEGWCIWYMISHSQSITAEVFQQFSEWQCMCYLRVALCRPSDEEVLISIQCEGLDGWVMGLESVEQLPLADVKHTHKALSASSDQQLLFRSILQHCGPILMAGESWKKCGKKYESGSQLDIEGKFLK